MRCILAGETNTKCANEYMKTIPDGDKLEVDVAGLGRGEAGNSNATSVSEEVRG